MQTISILLIDIRFLFFLDISGERLWLELKRTAEGRNAGPVLKVMFEQNIGQYLGRISSIDFLMNSIENISGIPSDVDLNQLEEHWRKCHSSQPHALTILTKLFRNLDEVSAYQNHLFNNIHLSFVLVIKIRTTNEIFQ